MGYLDTKSSRDLSAKCPVSFHNSSIYSLGSEGMNKTIAQRFKMCGIPPHMGTNCKNPRTSDLWFEVFLSVLSASGPQVAQDLPSHTLLVPLTVLP